MATDFTEANNAILVHARQRGATIPGLIPAVQQQVAEIKERGGLTAAEIQRAAELCAILGSEKGEIVLYGGGKPGERADHYNQVAHAVAVLSLLPGGVDLFGCHFEFH